MEPEFDKTTDAKIATDNAIAKSGRTVSREDRNMLLDYARQMSEYERDVARLNATSLQPAQRLLECWTVDTVSERNKRDSTIGMPKKQERSQVRLQQMAEEFRESTFRLPASDGHERVRWILELRNAREDDRGITWIYTAGRVVEYESIGADDSATQTVMVIIEAVRDNIDERRKALRATQAIPFPVPGARPSTKVIPRPVLRPQNGLLNPHSAGIVRVVSDPGRKPQQKSAPASSRGNSPAPSNIPTVATSNTTVKHIHTDGRCKWGVKCRTLRCSNKHPPVCRLGDKCRSLSCNYEHPAMLSCPDGSDCKRPHCNKDHGRGQCKRDPCTDDNCALRHCAGQKAVSGWWAVQRVD